MEDIQFFKIMEHNSSLIKASKYVYEEKELFIEFVNGQMYCYIDVDKETYENFTQAESVGKFLNESIKGKFEYTKI